MRLIDADLLKKNLTGVEIAQYLENGTITDTYDGSTVMEIIDEQPIAYDVDGVAEELKRMSGIQFDGCNESYELNWCISTDSAIEIVKGAVKE